MAKKDSILNKEIKLGNDSYPTKRTMNFVIDSQQGNNKITLLCFVIFLVILVLFTKFGVIDTINKTNKLESDYYSSQSTYNSLNESLADYDQIEEKYNQMIGSFMSDSEASCLNRSDIIDLLDDNVTPYVGINHYTINGNNITVYTTVTDLNTVSKVLDRLQSDSRTAYVTVSRTLADSSDSSLVSADIEITYNSLDGGNN